MAELYFDKEYRKRDYQKELEAFEKVCKRNKVQFISGQEARNPTSSDAIKPRLRRRCAFGRLANTINSNEMIFVDLENGEIRQGDVVYIKDPNSSKLETYIAPAKCHITVYKKGKGAYERPKGVVHIVSAKKNKF